MSVEKFIQNYVSQEIYTKLRQSRDLYKTTSVKKFIQNYVSQEIYAKLRQPRI